jgi:hypothetical protein
MGLIARSVTNKQYPFSQLASTVKQIEQLKTVAMRYGLEDALDFSPPPRDWSELSSTETMFRDISE